MKTILSLLTLLAWPMFPAVSAPFDAAPFALPLPEGSGLLWEDPREIHKVVVHFERPVTANEVQLQYWGSRWPDQVVPKDKQPGGGSVGWMELGNWHQGGWRTADTETKRDGSTITFTFRPLNAKEYPKKTEYPVTFRYTLKVRVTSPDSLPGISRIEAFTDSETASRQVRLAFGKGGASRPKLEVFNGRFEKMERVGAGVFLATVNTVQNRDPNTFDRTLVTVTHGKDRFTFAMDDLADGALFIPAFSAAVLAPSDSRDYAAVARDCGQKGGQTLYDRVGLMPEQTWDSAWKGMPKKKSRIYLPLSLDGGRHKFRLDPNGSIYLRSNDHYLKGRPGKDTPRLALEGAPVRLAFDLASNPADRYLEEDSLPVCHTIWETNGLRIEQTSFVTELNGAKGDEGVPEADSVGVFMTRFAVTNTSSQERVFAFPLRYSAGDKPASLTVAADGLLQARTHTRGQLLTDGIPSTEQQTGGSRNLAPGEARTWVLKFPYVVLTNEAEQAALKRLEFEPERLAVAGYWRRRLNESARLITPEPVLNQFYRAHAGHLLINCEREPASSRRFARVGSFSYGAYGNESCMMVVDLDRRGMHREAQECLDAWLHYQGSVRLPGDFSSQVGILYGAGGYEAGGYNQHHGWILWCLAEHYRFTRDREWLQSAAPGILAGADWIIRETERTRDRHPLERGLLPAGSLEDIGDWWTWLSTSCYTWRGLDSAAWALEQLSHPEAARVRQGADEYRRSLLKNFTAAAERSPVVRLRDGSAVPHFPSYTHRRGRSFGWICETLEGAIHLIITGVIDPHSKEAEWILKDYEDNLYLSNQYGYTVNDFDRYWFSRGGMSMQACLLLDVEPYLYRDDVKHALRATFNAIAVSHFPDVHMNTEHALPYMDDWTGDHYKSSDEANACGWLRNLFVRESGNDLLLGQAVPRDWMRPGERCGIDRAATHFGPVTLIYTAREKEITARLDGPHRNPPQTIRLRFRSPDGGLPQTVTVNGKPWKDFAGEWVRLPGDIEDAEIVAKY